MFSALDTKHGYREIDNRKEVYDWTVITSYKGLIWINHISFGAGKSTWSFWASNGCHSVHGRARSCFWTPSKTVLTSRVAYKDFSYMRGVFELWENEAATLKMKKKCMDMDFQPTWSWDLSKLCQNCLFYWECCEMAGAPTHTWPLEIAPWSLWRRKRVFIESGKKIWHPWAHQYERFSEAELAYTW